MSIFRKKQLLRGLRVLRGEFFLSVFSVATFSLLSPIQRNAHVRSLHSLPIGNWPLSIFRAGYKPAPTFFHVPEQPWLFPTFIDHWPLTIFTEQRFYVFSFFLFPPCRMHQCRDSTDGKERPFSCIISPNCVILFSLREKQRSNSA